MDKPVVFITGASAGFGRALAREWAARGARLLLTARSAERLFKVAEDLRRTTEVLAEAIDVCDDASNAAFVASAIERFGAIDVLVNNASTIGSSPMPRCENLGAAEFFELMEVNVRAPLAIAQHVIPHMRAAASGKIANVTSDAAVNAYAGWGGYGASKAALEHLSRILAAELEGSCISIVVLDPGNMNTQMHRDAEPAEDLSGLPSPDSVAPHAVDLIEGAALPYQRYEVQAVGAGV